MIDTKDIKWIERSQLNTNLYDKVVENDPQTNIYALSWYLDAVSDNWGVLILGNYEAVMPFSYTVKKGQSIIYQPFFSRQTGLFGKDYSFELILQFIEAIPSKFKLIHFGFPYHFQSELQVEEVVHQELELNDTYETIVSGFSTNAKRQINKALKNKVEVKEIEDPQTLIDLFKETKGEAIGLNEDNFARLLNLMHAGLSEKKAILLGAYFESELIASAFYFIQDSRITYLKGASNKKGRELGGMYLIMSKVIQEHSLSQKVLDFGGSKIKSIADFYHKFGAKDIKYYLYEQNKLTFPLKQVKILRDKLKKRN